jgi:hypothetical protein
MDSMLREVIARSTNCSLSDILNQLDSLKSTRPFPSSEKYDTKTYDDAYGFIISRARQDSNWYQKYQDQPADENDPNVIN